MSGSVNPLLGLADMSAPVPANGILPAQPAPVADPGDFSSRYNTALSPTDEARYQAWGQAQAAQNGGRNPAADVYDYDMRGFWQSGQSFADNGHAGDAFKKPNHPTFSDQSRYHGVDGHQGGSWGGGKDGQPWTFAPGPSNMQMHDPGDLQRYFQKREPGNRLILQAPGS